MKRKVRKWTVEECNATKLMIFPIFMDVFKFTASAPFAIFVRGPYETFKSCGVNKRAMDRAQSLIFASGVFLKAKYFDFEHGDGMFF